MPAIESRINFDQLALKRVCQQFGVRKLSIFGSVARGDASADSDIDILYELDAEVGRKFSLFDLENLAEALRPIFGSRFVDITTLEGVHWFIRDHVEEEAQVIYEK